MIAFNNRVKSSDDFLKSSVDIANYYGFLPISSVLNEYDKPKRSQKLKSVIQHFDYTGPEIESAEVMRSYIAHGFAKLEQPTLFYSNTSDKEQVNFSLKVIGSKKTIAEAILLKTTLAILDELGISNTCVYINGVGDRDSTARYTKELNNYFRKHIEDLPGSVRQAMKKDLFLAYNDLFLRKHELCKGAPNTMQFLNEASRIHLREILEYLDGMGVRYEIDTSLIGSGNCHTKTFFEIREEPSEDRKEYTVFASGGRFDELSRRAFRQEIPAAGVTLTCERRGRVNKKYEAKKTKKPRVCFIQLGFDAKLKSLSVIETLRKSKVPVYQTLGYERLTDQLLLAQEMQIPYAVIMGQKEALDGAVVVRDLDTRSQKTVLIGDLPAYLRTI
ncbi:MAG: ATP phosphoribosyltransferase regulatory subunit [Parcubacteria group bacterium]|nr:ATP phosphoribosyltransferase regulatory subunit [Parcubacteria group bacterium]